MSRYHADDDEGEDEFADDDYGHGDYGNGDEDEPTVPCPYCRREIHEDAVQCPHCQRYISAEDAPVSKPWWLLAGVALCLYIVYRWLFD